MDQAETTRAKTIMLVMPELFWGGAETQFRYLIKGLNKSQNNLKVVVEHSRRERNSQDGDFINSLEANVEILEPLGDGSKGASMLTQARGLKQFFSQYETNKPDVILIYSGVSFLLIPWLKSKGHIVLYSDRNGEKDTLRQRIKRRFYASADTIVCNSEPTYEMRKQKNNNVVFIPNGTKVYEGETSSNYSSTNILMVSRVAPVKNIECAMRALAHLPKEFSITLIGKIEDYSYKKRLEQLARELGIEEQFIFAGYVSDVDAHFLNCFCTILPSFEEGMPNAVLESWTHGRIAIVSDIPSNRALVKEPTLLFPPEDPNALANQILALKALNEEEYESLSKTNKKIVKQDYSIQNMVKKYEKLFGTAPHHS